ncbi:SLMAP protein, partial [Polypterus senegalus]
MPSALAVFTCRPNSHPFQERHVYLDEPVKIGRSVARCRPAQNNATFDCKVLSRNHALVWFDHKTGKFYLQDTKSSNGTFINSQRLSRGSEESPPCEVLSGDIIQFGVDVTENTRKVTHGCIVSTIKLFLPDGLEARRRTDVIPAPLPLPVDKAAANAPSMYSQELFQLSQYLQEALHREQMLEQKLATLQRLLASTQEASESSWQNQTEDGIRKELVALQEDKHNYETTAKESLRRVLQEKIEVVRKLSEVERSLSNTEDECTHLKEMNERTQEELKELANKYNGAVNEIKDLTDKLKQAEGRQEEIQQKGLSEKKELQHKIEEMEEKEQALQARIEALQADNDFTNERLTALQVRLEQLQEKNIKEHNSLDKEVRSRLNLNYPLYVHKSVIDARLDSNQNTDENFLRTPDKLKAKLIDDEHLLRVMEETKLLKENQVEAKESDMSDTLSPSKEKSSDDTTDGQMDEHELTEPPIKVSLLKDEVQRLNFDSGDTEKVIQHLHKELVEAQELAKVGKQKCVELQALLEEERRSSQQQTEESKKQIQFLQAHLHKLQKDIEILKEEKESEISNTRDELANAQEEISVMRHAMEVATSEREKEIVFLQEDLSTVQRELEKWRKAASQYEEEITGLQANFQFQKEIEKLQKECLRLQRECAALHKEREGLLEKLQQLEKELDRQVYFCSHILNIYKHLHSHKHSVELTSNLGVLQKTHKDLENKIGAMEEQHQQDASGLRNLLAEADSRAETLQKEYEETQTRILELKGMFDKTEQEKQSLAEELQMCKANLKMLQEKGNNVSCLNLFVFLVF